MKMRVPVTTYRLQFNRGFHFEDARALVPYLHDLGITGLYASPFFKTRQGSSHGYDVTDHTTINPEIGTDADLEDLIVGLNQHGMGLVIDVVPNHMGIDDESNRWWWDVLENGLSSPYARFFDIDWAPPKEDLANKVLLPILGDQYGKVLEHGGLQLLYEGGAFFIAYYNRRYPVAPKTWIAVLNPALEKVCSVLAEDDPHLVELESIITSLEHLPPRTETDPERVRERQREKEVAKRRLATLVDASETVREAVDKAVAGMNGRQGDPRSFDRLEAFLANQAYRLCHWRVATDEINYRRFFDVNELAAIRVEQPEVFEAVHTIIFRLLSQGCVTGLRIDHPDGLFDPEQYFLDLQWGCRHVLTGTASFVPQTFVGVSDHPCYVVVEKILVRDERLRPHWAVHGTTGYEFLNLLNGIFIDPDSDRPFRDLYARFTGHTFNFGDVAYESKKLILDVSMSGELHVLARRLDRISEQHRWSRDFTLFSLQEALREVIACFPVYRTYIRAASNVVNDEDRHYILSAIRTAKRRNPAMSESIFDFIASVLLLQDPEGLGETDRAERWNFVMRFQQFTGPVMAKGLEDTAFYRAYPLASLNEVGGNPERFGLPIVEFHRQNAERLMRWPYTLLATSTHDTKRSEDVRARINVLSEMADDWERAIQRWQSWNREKKVELEGNAVPEANEEYLLYQTLVGTWPLQPMDEEAYAEFTERIGKYMEKALKEARLHTSWINPNEAYDQAVRNFVRAILVPDLRNRFLADFIRFHVRIAHAGLWNSLSQTLLKIASPGVPDFYQGTELWDFSLVDPDNRRPVDFEKRKRFLQEIIIKEQEDMLAFITELLATKEDGRIKLFLIYRALKARRAQRELFQNGEYIPLEVRGRCHAHLVAFARKHERSWAITIVPRLLTRLVREGEAPLGKTVWDEASLVIPEDAPSFWEDAITAQLIKSENPLPIGDVLRHFPVGLLMSKEG